MLADVEEGQPMFEGVFLYEKADGIGRLCLKVAMLDVKDLVEETPDMETESVFLLFRELFCVFIIEYPSALRECKLQFITVIGGLI